MPRLRDYDLHAAAVADEIKKLGGCMHYWNPGFAADSRSVFRYSGKPALEVRDGNGAANFGSFHSFWYWRPYPVDLRDRLDPDYHDVVHEEWKFFLAGI